MHYWMYRLPSNANLLAEYRPRDGRPTIPAPLLILTMVPFFLSRKAGRAPLMVRRHPKKFVSICLSISASLKSVVNSPLLPFFCSRFALQRYFNQNPHTSYLLKAPTAHNLHCSRARSHLAPRQPSLQCSRRLDSLRPM